MLQETVTGDFSYSGRKDKSVLSLQKIRLKSFYSACMSVPTAWMLRRSFLTLQSLHPSLRPFIDYMKTQSLHNKKGVRGTNTSCFSTSRVSEWQLNIFSRSENPIDSPAGYRGHSHQHDQQTFQTMCWSTFVCQWPWTNVSFYDFLWFLNSLCSALQSGLGSQRRI